LLLRANILRSEEHITPVLALLHWLKTAERFEYKIALLTFKALTTGKPDYLSGQLQLYDPVRQLRSSDRKIVSTPIAIGRRSPVGHSEMLRLSSAMFSLPHQLTDDLSCPASFRRN